MVNEVNTNVQEKGIVAEEEMLEGVEDFAAMLEESFKKREDDTFVEGVIVEIKDDSALVDVGKKLEGRLALSEILDESGNLIYKEGDKLKVVISGFRNERPIVSHKKALRREKVRDFIENYDQDGDNTDNAIVSGKIIGKNRGGFIVESSEGVEFFLPKSQAGYKDLNSVIGKKIDAKIVKIDKEAESIVISRKKFLDEERKKKRNLIQNLLKEEDPVEGVIKKITTYGMFVDVGGVDGLVHYSEISYKGPVNPASVYSEGEKVAVKAINYDKDKRHLSLSIKAAQPDPREEIKDELEVGDAIKVVVSYIEPYGAFVDLGNDIEGFLHISEISWDKNIKHPKDYISVDDEIDVEVIEIDCNEKRLRVSLKNILPKPFEEFLNSYKIGDVVTGKITSITNFGAFVKIGSIEGLLHNEDASWSRNKKCKDLFKVGDEIEVKIVKIDETQEKVSLSRKELLDSPAVAYAKKHRAGEIVNGTVRDIKDFGVFVELEDGVDALIRREDMGGADEEIKIGDSIEAAIAFIDENKNRIRLSVKKLSKIKEREALREINSDDRVTLGDIIKDHLK